MSLKQIITSLMMPASLGVSAYESGRPAQSANNYVGSAQQRFWTPSFSAALIASATVRLEGGNR
jgi:hypothetical protein